MAEEIHPEIETIYGLANAYIDRQYAALGRLQGKIGLVLGFSFGGRLAGGPVGLESLLWLDRQGDRNTGLSGPFCHPMTLAPFAHFTLDHHRGNRVRRHEIYRRGTHVNT